MALQGFAAIDFFRRTGKQPAGCDFAISLARLDYGERRLRLFEGRGVRIQALSHYDSYRPDERNSEPKVTGRPFAQMGR